MKLDKILEAADAEGVPREQVQKYINYCVKHTLNGRPDLFEYMLHLFEGVDLKFTAEEAREIVKKYLDSGYWSEDNAKVFGILHGLIPEEEVRAFYYTQWENTGQGKYPDYSKIKCLKAITGYDVPFSQYELSERFEILVGKKDFTNLVHFLEATSFKPTSESVHGLYELIIREPSLKFHASLIPEIEKATGVKPEFDNDEIQRGYIEILREGSYYDVDWLERATGIAPIYSKEALDDLYQKLFEKKDYEQMGLVKDITKIAHSLPQEQINAAADACAESGDVHNLEIILRKLANQRVTLKLGKVQQGYRALAEYRNIDSMRKLNLLTRGPMPQDVADRILERAVESDVENYDDPFSEALSLIKSCGAKPAETIVNRRLSFLLEKNRWNEYSRLQDEAGIEPGDNVYRAAVRAMKKDLDEKPGLFEGY